ncbi:MAG: hypothetical protein EZS28_046389 [Streblomastix strix]|uniref:Uncharacterized protein n=1 Tax=Streblomastix strix TaxID=222440 RepID=A0A5J4TKP7_9EUKA|nr:MAG: hypothetical protein EZS28_046389 [Streblomastix strix]
MILKVVAKAKEDQLNKLKQQQEKLERAIVKEQKEKEALAKKLADAEDEKKKKDDEIAKLSALLKDKELQIEQMEKK